MLYVIFLEESWLLRTETLYLVHNRKSEMGAEDTFRLRSHDSDTRALLINHSLINQEPTQRTVQLFLLPLSVLQHVRGKKLLQICIMMVAITICKAICTEQQFCWLGDLILSSTFWKGIVKMADSAQSALRRVLLLLSSQLKIRHVKCCLPTGQSYKSFCPSKKLLALFAGGGRSTAGVGFSVCLFVCLGHRWLVF